MTVRIPREVKALCFIVFLMLTFDSVQASITQDVNSLYENAQIISNSFMQDSFELRMKYQYSNCSLKDQDREKLYEIAAKASEQLHQILKVQQTIKNKIENYQASDWEEKYGKTGSWKKLVSDYSVTNLITGNIDYYRALAAPGSEKNKILSEILSMIDSLDKSINSPDAKLLKAKTTAQLAGTDLVYKPSAIHLLNSLANEVGVPEPIRFSAAIEKINLLGNSDREKIDELLNKFWHSSCRENFEILLPLIFFKRQFDSAAFEKTFEKWPDARNFLAPLVLSEVQEKIKDVNQINIFDAELAALAAWKNNAKSYAPMLEKLSEKFQTPLILYVTGTAIAEDSPEKSVNLLLQAAKLANSKSLMEVSQEQICRQAANLAYNVFTKDSSKCDFTISSFENYLTCSADKIDPQLEYLYTTILNQCGQHEKARQLLQKISSRNIPSDIWQKRAALDLIIQIVTETNSVANSRASLAENLEEFISDCPRKNNDFIQLYDEAVTIYCQLLLAANDSQSAKKVLTLLEDYDSENSPHLVLLKSKALLQLEDFSQAAQVIANLDGKTCPGYYNYTMELLGVLTKKLDFIEAKDKDFARTVPLCEKIAQDCITNLKEERKEAADLYLAEIIIFSQQPSETKISKINKLLEHNKSKGIDLMRCRARFLAEQNKFEEAGKIWSKISESIESRNTSAENSFGWWQAKYFELYCGSKVKKIAKDKIIHSIEVLNASSSNIPAFWDEKLTSLNGQCVADIKNN